MNFTLTGDKIFLMGDLRMKRFGSVLSKVLFMILLAGMIIFNFSGCSDGSKRSVEENSKTPEKTSSQTAEANPTDSATNDGTSNGTSNETSSPATSKPDNMADNEQKNEPESGEKIDSLKDVDTESALKLATGLLLGIADTSIIPTEQPTVVTAKPGEKSYMVGSCDILKKIQFAEVPQIKVIESKNAAWRITFTYQPEITVEVVDDIDNPQKVIKLYPEEGI